MSNAKDFVIKDGVLKKYKGAGGAVVIPEGVTTIGSSAFSFCTSLFSVTIPDSVTAIGNFSFSNCWGLSSVTIPDSVTAIGDGAFSGCWKLTSVTVPDSVTTMGHGVFFDCRKLAAKKGFVIIRNVLCRYQGTAKNVVIPEGVTTIDEWAFHKCNRLTSVTIPDSVTIIHKEAFSDCSTDFAVYCSAEVFPKLPKEIKDQTAAAWLTGTHTFNEVQTEGIRKYAARIKMKLIDQVAEDCAEPVSKLLSLGKMKLEDLETCISKYNDGVHPQILAILLDYKNKHYTAQESAALEQDRWEKELGIKELTPAEWKKIFGFSTKDGEISITGYKGTDPAVEIPAEIGGKPVRIIKDSAFRYRSIQSIFIPNSVVTIGKYAFADCSSLTSITIPEGVTSIGSDAFCNCSRLTIHASAGSYAETYAKKNNIPFVAE